MQYGFLTGEMHEPQFAFKDDLIVHERFFFDLSELCAQLGVSTDAVRNRIFGAAAALPVAAE
jgi:hypothetical protein